MTKIKKQDNIRPVPNRGLIFELTGRDIKFIEQAHHGLCETPMQALYPYLNLDELLVFEAGSWGYRRNGSSDFARLIGEGELYPIFNRINQVGFPYLQRIQKLAKWKNKSAELNPFGRSRTLRQRLEGVAPEEVKKLLEGLSHPVNKYVFESQYEDARRENGRSNLGLEILRFMPFYPKSNEVHVGKYASEIAEIMSKYPVQYVPIAKPSAEVEMRSIYSETPKPETARQETIPIIIGKRRRKVDTQPRLFSTE